MNAHTSILAERYAELTDIVDQACAGGIQGRGIAQRYAMCRQQLLQERGRGSVPGFIVQCVSVDRFVEFITLFHPDVSERRAFLTQQFSNFRLSPTPAAHINIFDDPL